MTTEMTDEQIAQLEAALANYIVSGSFAARGPGSYRATVLADTDIEWLRDDLPVGWAAEWLGEGNTDARGTRYEDIVLRRTDP